MWTARRNCSQTWAKSFVLYSIVLFGILQVSHAQDTLYLWNKPIDAFMSEPVDVKRNLEHYIPELKSPNDQDFSCDIPAGSGVMAGICVPAHEAQLNMAFCKDSVTYPVCVPPVQPYWPIWDIAQKDQLLEELFKRVVDERIRKESNLTFEKYVPRRYLQNQACIESLKSIMCWHNFPRCKSGANSSFPVCRTACKTYYENCLYSEAERDLFCSDNQIALTGLFDAWNQLVMTEDGIAEDDPMRDTIPSDRLSDDEECTGASAVVGVSSAAIAMSAVLLFLRN